ncbi:hypothetical protein MKW94_009468 [Papaver nudicaule]|uniref:Uncharacterized protein n=1 Tax=Papaver nudicaule TaxID=74823 RepID=A0AA41VPC7_PAPNU|nr:hypothetical protein [Papaver nudicaule]
MTDSIRTISPSMKSLPLVSKPRFYNSTRNGFLPIHQIFSLSPSLVGISSKSKPEQFDRIMGETQQLDQSLVIDGNLCRKCVYLKPKLEKWQLIIIQDVLLIDHLTCSTYKDGSNVLHVLLLPQIIIPVEIKANDQLCLC